MYGYQTSVFQNGLLTFGFGLQCHVEYKVAGEQQRGDK